MAHFLWGREKATVPVLTLSSVSMVKTKCCPGPVLTSIWGHDWSEELASISVLNTQCNLYLFVKVPGVDDGPVGHGEGVAGTLGHLHPAGRHPDVGGVCNVGYRL